MSEKSNPSLALSEKHSHSLTDTSASFSGLADTGELTGVDELTTDLSQSELTASDQTGKTFCTWSFLNLPLNFLNNVFLLRSLVH